MRYFHFADSSVEVIISSMAIFCSRGCSGFWLSSWSHCHLLFQTSMFLYFWLFILQRCPVFWCCMPVVLWSTFRFWLWSRSNNYWSQSGMNHSPCLVLFRFHFLGKDSLNTVHLSCFVRCDPQYAIFCSFGSDSSLAPAFDVELHEPLYFSFSVLFWLWYDFVLPRGW